MLIMARDRITSSPFEAFENVADPKRQSPVQRANAPDSKP